MFLNEVAMGDMYKMYRDGEVGFQQKSAPDKKQSTWAIGHTEPGKYTLSELYSLSVGRCCVVKTLTTGTEGPRFKTAYA